MITYDCYGKPCEKGEGIFVLRSDYDKAMQEKDDLLIAERAVSQCLREDFNEARKQIATLETAIKEKERESDEEIGRWQQGIYKLVMELSGHEVDGSGCDSGDSLDLTLSEIQQGFSFLQEKIASLERHISVLREFANGEAQVELPSGIYYVPPPVAEYIENLREDAMRMALRLYGENPDTFGPECREVMGRWGKEVEKVLGKEGI